MMSAVMPGFMPGIHVYSSGTKDVDGRDEPGHDESGVIRYIGVNI